MLATYDASARPIYIYDVDNGLGVRGGSRLDIQALEVTLNGWEYLSDFAWVTFESDSPGWPNPAWWEKRDSVTFFGLAHASYGHPGMPESFYFSFSFVGPSTMLDSIAPPIAASFLQEADKSVASIFVPEVWPATYGNIDSVNAFVVSEPNSFVLAFWALGVLVFATGFRRNQFRAIPARCPLLLIRC